MERFFSSRHSREFFVRLLLLFPILANTTGLIGWLDPGRTANLRLFRVVWGSPAAKFFARP